MHKVRRVLLGTMYKRRDGMGHTVMPTAITAEGVRYEDVNGIHIVETSHFLRTFEPLDPEMAALIEPSLDGFTCWDHLTED